MAPTHRTATNYSEHCRRRVRPGLGDPQRHLQHELQPIEQSGPTSPSLPTALALCGRRSRRRGRAPPWASTTRSTTQSGPDRSSTSGRTVRTRPLIYTSRPSRAVRATTGTWTQAWGRSDPPGRLEGAGGHMGWYAVRASRRARSSGSMLPAIPPIRRWGCVSGRWGTSSTTPTSSDPSPRRRRPVQVSPRQRTTGMAHHNFQVAESGDWG